MTTYTRLVLLIWRLNLILGLGHDFANKTKSLNLQWTINVKKGLRKVDSHLLWVNLKNRKKTVTVFLWPKLYTHCQVWAKSQFETFIFWYNVLWLNWRCQTINNKQLKNNNELLLYIIYLKGFCHVVVRTSCRCLYRTSGIINQLHYGATCAKMQKKFNSANPYF